jgi:hypothetical protein
MASVVEIAVATGQQAGLALPKRAVLWETTATGEPREAARSLPPGATWVKDGTATHTNRFNVDGDATQRVFTLFESDAEPRVGELSFISGFTGSGVPVSPTKRHSLTLPWVIGIVATVLFFWMLSSLAWTSHSITQARDLMDGTLPVPSAIYLSSTTAARRMATSFAKAPSRLALRQPLLPLASKRLRWARCPRSTAPHSANSPGHARWWRSVPAS